MRRLLAAAIVLAFVGIAGLVRADDKPNPIGTWKWTVTFGGQSREMTLKLKLDGDKLTGAMVREGRETPIQHSKYTGIVSGDTITGKREFQRGGQTQSRHWEAKRVKD